METLKKKLWNCVEFLYKHKVIAFLVAFTIATSFILYGVLANDDEYANKLVVSNARVAEIADGSELYENFDEAEGDGNDTGPNNGIVRNYDSVAYNVDYSLILKEGTITDPIEGRNVIVDVVIPSSIDAELLPSNSTGDGYISSQSLGTDYKYFEYIIPGVSATVDGNLSFTFTLSNINTTTPGTQFKPIVLIKEATDEESTRKAISELTAEEKESFASNIPNTQVSCDENSIQCTTTITGIYAFNVNLLQGDYNASQSTLTEKKFPVGIAISIPKKIGVYIPNSVSFNLNSSFDDTKLAVNYVENSFVNYKNTDANYKINIDIENELPTSINNSVTFENGVVTIGSLKLTSNPYGIIGTAAFEISSTRLTDQNDKNNYDISFTTTDLKIGDNIYSTTGGSLTVTDYYKKFVGAFASIVDIYSGDTVANENSKLIGNAFVNLNERITIKESISYGINGVGDELSELNNYIKVDPRGITVLKGGVTVSNNTAIVKYYYGDWTSEYFELTNETGCPTNIATLTRENLMNLYGGPCLVGKDTLISGGADTETTLPIVIIDVVFGDKEDSSLNVPASSREDIIINALGTSDCNAVNNSYQISTLSTGYFDNTLYYLSDSINDNDVTNAKSVNSYIKSVYDFNEKVLLANEVMPCTNNELGACNISGDTIHLIGFTVNDPKIETYFNDSKRSSFYDYPIEWRIDTSTSQDMEITYDGAYVAVTIPNALKYLYAETINPDDGSRTRKNYESITDANNSKVYLYYFDESEIKNGAIYTLSIFTDIYLNTKTGTDIPVYALSEFSGYMVNGTDVVELTDARPFSIRGTTKNDVIIHNSGAVTTYGNAAPRYIEKYKQNGTNISYKYTMKSYNNSSSLVGNNQGYAFNNATMYYVLPYIEDSSYKIYKRVFTNSTYKIKLIDTDINSLSGYKLYYTTDAAVNVVSSIYGTVAGDHISWREWTNPTTDIQATAIKIEKTGSWDIDDFFVSEDGVTVEVTPINNAPADAYYNGFVLKADRPQNYPVAPCDALYENCENRVISPNLFFQSSKSLVEVYSRQISGFVFEDYNYNGIYDLGEKQMDKTVVELYKLNNSSFTDESDKTNPNAFINPEVDELIDTKETDSYGNYSFIGLDPGYYYVIFRYNGEKYTPTETHAGDLNITVTNATRYDSKAVARNKVDNEAVSEIIPLSSTSASDSKPYMNLGLRIRKEFAVEINKYITKIVQTSNQGTKTYEYDKATKVNIDIKNLKNTKFRVTYSFDIVNTKYFPGYIGVVADLVPAGMTFDGTLEENKDWVIYDGVLYYTGLQDKLLLPGDKQYFNLVLDVDTNQGGTYLNIIAAQQPILMGDDYSEYDFGDVTVDTDTPVETTDGNNTGDNTTGDNTSGDNSQGQGNGVGD